MSATDQATFIANAVSEGINCLAYIRSLHAEPPVASPEALSEWCKMLDDLQSGLKTIQEGQVEGHVVVTSLPASSDLVRCIEDVRTHLSEIAPGERLPASLFHLVDVAWAEFGEALAPQQ